MNGFLQPDTLFSVALVAIIIVAALLIVALGYVIGILYDLKRISRIFRKSAAFLGSDMRSAWRAVFQFFQNAIIGETTTKKRKRKK